MNVAIAERVAQLGPPPVGLLDRPFMMLALRANRQARPAAEAELLPRLQFANAAARALGNVATLLS